MTATDELRRCLQALSQPASVQRSLFPDFVVVGDELALSFEDARRDFLALDTSLPRRQLDALTALDDYLAQLSGSRNAEFWCDPAALATDSRWEHVRALARAALAAFSWDATKPQLDGALYVNEDRVVRNVDK